MNPALAVVLSGLAVVAVYASTRLIAAWLLAKWARDGDQ